MYKVAEGNKPHTGWGQSISVHPGWCREPGGGGLSGDWGPAERDMHDSVHPVNVRDLHDSVTQRSLTSTVSRSVICVSTLKFAV